MTTNPTELSAGQLIDRADRLETALDEAAGRISPELAHRAAGIAAKARERVDAGLGQTVVALAGATGSGKSSMFNALSGLEIAGVGARRPTTSAPSACVWGTDGEETLDWLDIPADRRTWRESALDADDEKPLRGLILLDLPDYDSVAATHRIEADRLVSMVDLLVWVVDPQKYADRLLHESYLQPMIAQASNMLVVLNQADALSADEQTAVKDELAKLLADRGLETTNIQLASALTGEGIEGIRTELASSVQTRAAAAQRLGSEFDDVACRIRAELGEPGSADLLADDSLSDSLVDAAGIPALEETLRSDYLRRAYRLTGWVPLTWFAAARPDPLGREHDPQQKDDLVRASAPAPTATQYTQVKSAAREATATATEKLAGAWQDAVAEAERESTENLNETIDAALSGVSIVRGTPGWWIIVCVLQWLFFVATVIGIAWLVTDLFTAIGPWWSPIILAGGGIIGSVIVSVCAAAGRRTGATSSAANAGDSLRAAVRNAAASDLLKPVADVLARHDAAHRALQW